MTTRIWTAKVEQDPDNPEEQIVILPDDLIEEMGWGPGDTLDWNIDDNGTVTLTKIG